MIATYEKPPSTYLSAHKAVRMIAAWAFIWLGLCHPAIASENSRQLAGENPKNPSDPISIDLNPAEILLGEPTTLSIRVRAGKSANWQLPSKLDLPPFIELSRTKSTESFQGEETELIKIELATFEELGDLVIPSFRLEMTTPSGVMQKSIPIPASNIRVLSVLEGIPDLKPRDIAGPVEVAVADYRLLVLMSLCMIWLLMGMYLRKKAFRLYRANRTSEKFDYSDARKLAQKKLREIIQDNLLQTGHIKEYFMRISETVREYTGKALGFFALDLTTCELLEEIEARRVPDPEFDAIKRILEETDLVKFANVHPTIEMSSNIIERAFDLIEKFKWSPAQNL